MSAYNAMIPGLQNSLTSMAQSPLNNSYFQNQLAMQQKSASQIGQRNISNIAQNTRASGGLLSGAGGYQSAMINNDMLSNSANQSGAFNSSLTNALTNRNFALQGQENFNPLQTGSTTQQSKSGLGTWLAPIAGAAIQGLTGGLGGMASGAAGALSQAQNTSGNMSMLQSPTPQGNSGSSSNPWGF
jgi:hypothetical protein